MIRLLFAVIVVVLVAISAHDASAPAAQDEPLTEIQLAWAPGETTMAQARWMAASVTAPVRACGCASGPELVDVLVLAGLLALRTVSERMLTGRH